MENPNLILKPSMINSLVPTFVRNLFYSFILMLFVWGIIEFIEVLRGVTYSGKFIWLVFSLFLIAILSLSLQVVVLYNTRYYFFDTYVSKEFQFLMIKKHSVPYGQIVDIATNVSIWDRLCNAGDLVLHTAEEKAPNLTLSFIKAPEEIEAKIYSLLNKNKSKDN